MTFHDSSLEDTDLKTREHLYSLLRTLSPQERVERMARLNSFGRKMMLASIKEANPNCTDEELRIHLARRLHGDEFVKKYLSK